MEIRSPSLEGLEPPSEISEIFMTVQLIEVTAEIIVEVFDAVVNTKTGCSQ